MKPIKGNQYFFRHRQMDFETQCALGGCCYGAAEAGEILAAAKRIRDGDFESWFREYFALAERTRAAAERCAAAGHAVSARESYLRASAYYALANVMVDGSDDPSRLRPTFELHRSCWDGFCSRLEPPAERVEIPFSPVPLPGYFFRPAAGRGPFPVVIFNNGSDGPISGMWGCGIAGALRRGYAAFTFDGPGQNALLWRHGVPFRPDWEKVIAPVVDSLSGRPDVDSGRIALSGISQGGYWVLRAAAFERRIAAVIADPGVMDVSSAITANVPAPMLKLLDAGREEAFNREMRLALRVMGKAVRQNLAFRMKPYGTQSYFRWIAEARQYHLRDVIKEIRCPAFIADPEDEQFWPGQPREVYEALVCPKTLVPFTADEGANWHCEPLARSLYDQRLFDWLASVLPVS